MKSVAVVAAFIGLAAAQFSALPTCAENCASKFLAGGSCGSDPKCICSDKTFLGNIACCLAQAGGCDTADQSSAIVFASQICAAQGISVPSAVVCTATSTASGSASLAATVATASATTTAATSTATGTTSSSTKTSSSSSSSSSSTTAGAATTATTGSKAWAPRETGAVNAGLIGGAVAMLALL